MSPAPETRLVTSNDEARGIASACLQQERLAVDVEADGMHAYHPKLCAMQIEWGAGVPGRCGTAVIDTLAVDPSIFANVLSSDGPEKVLHDLSFDARMLQQCDIELGHVRDTSVAARFLSEEATGLAALVSKHFEVTLGKKYQHHNWALRPITDEQLDYMVGDVRYLLALDDKLRQEAHDKGITDEIALECAYKLATALGPPQKPRPPHTRVKGYHTLGEKQRAALYWLVEARENFAEDANIPPFRIAPNSLMLEMARKLPGRERNIRSMCGRNRRAARHARAWLEAIEQGRTEGAPKVQPPPAVPPPPKEVAARRKVLDAAFSKWRRKEAATREVDLQVITPGHCVSDVIQVLAEPQLDAARVRAELSAIPGFGTCRIERYTDALIALLPTP